MITVTKEEQKAIKALNALAKKWPDSLVLFSWAGSLQVWKDADGSKSVIESVLGIKSDGGDPDDGGRDVDDDPEIEYE